MKNVDTDLDIISTDNPLTLRHKRKNLIYLLVLSLKLAVQQTIKLQLFLPMPCKPLAVAEANCATNFETPDPVSVLSHESSTKETHRSMNKFKVILKSF